MYSKLMCALALIATFSVSAANAADPVTVKLVDKMFLKGEQSTVSAVMAGSVCGDLNGKSIFNDHKITRSCTDEVICNCKKTTDWSGSKYKDCVEDETNDEDPSDSFKIYCTCNDEGTAYNCKSIFSTLGASKVVQD